MMSGYGLARVQGWLALALFISPVWSAETPTVLDEVQVRAKKPKSPTIPLYQRPKEQVAQSIAYFDAKTVAKTGSNRLEDFATYSPSVQLADSNGSGSALNVRGFRVTQASIDGMPDIQGFYLRDPATVESIAVVKGRDSSVSGYGSPGGAILYTSKKPQFTAKRQANLAFSDPQAWHADLDVTGTLRDPQLAGRFVIAGQQTTKDHTNLDDDRFTVMPSLRWQDEQQRLDMSAEYGWQNHTNDQQVVLYNGKPLYNQAYTDPRSQAERRMSRVSVDYQRQLNAHWDATLKASHIEGRRKETLSSIAFPATDTGDLWYSYYEKLDQTQQQSTLKAELQHQTQTTAAQYQTQVGAIHDEKHSHFTQATSYGDGVVDILHPTFAYALPSDAQLSVTDFRMTWPEDAWYLQHKAQILDDKLTITAGWRATKTHMDGAIPELAMRSMDSSDTSKSLGILWQATPHWQGFASHTESFNPNLGFDRQGQLFDPEKSRQHEIGVRYQRKTTHGTPAQASLSTYRLDRTNVTTADPVDNNYSVLAGEMLAKGVELSVTQPLTRKLAIEANYAYTDARITHSNSGLTGKQLSNVPHHSGSLRVSYHPTAQTELAVNALRIGSRPGDNANSFNVAGYTRWDLYAEQRLNKQQKLSMGVQNALDKDYVAASSSELSMTQGRKRTVSVGWEVNF